MPSSLSHSNAGLLLSRQMKQQVQFCHHGELIFVIHFAEGVRYWIYIYHTVALRNVLGRLIPNTIVWKEFLSNL